MQRVMRWKANKRGGRQHKFGIRICLISESWIDFETYSRELCRLVVETIPYPFRSFLLVKAADGIS